MFFFLLLPFFLTLYLSFEKRRRKYQTFFFSHTVPIITVIEFCGFFRQFLVGVGE
jgi:hypothetical protein